MNIGGGEAADQLVRMMLSGTEVAVRLGGSALKNMLALSLALAKNNKTISGRVNLGRMLRETRDLRQFPMTPEQYREFSKLAKKQKILFSAIRDKDDQGKLIDVILPMTELDRANMILERVGYLAPESDMSQERRQPPEKGPKRFLKHWIEKARDKVKSMKRSEDERPPGSMRVISCVVRWLPSALPMPRCRIPWRVRFCRCLRPGRMSYSGYWMLIPLISLRL